MGPFLARFAFLPHLRAHLRQRAHAREVVGSHRHHKQRIDFLESAQHDLTHRAKDLGPAKALFNALSLFLAGGSPRCWPLHRARLNACRCCSAQYGAAL